MESPTTATQPISSRRPEPKETGVFLVKITEIKINADRGREEFGDLVEFSNDISANGLLQPLVVRPIKDDQWKYELVAGERRLKAILILGWNVVPCTLRTDWGSDQCDPLLARLKSKEAEAAENFSRKQMTSMEQAMLVRQITELKQQVHGAGGKGLDGGWTQKDTAAYTGLEPSTVSNQIKLAKFVDKNPDLKIILSQLDLNTAVRKVNQIEHTRKVHKKIESGDIKVRSELLLGDATELIKNVSDNSQDLILTDGPFGLDEIQEMLGQTKGPSATYTALLGESDNLSFTDALVLYERIVPEWFRVLKPSSHIYVFASGELLLQLIPMMQKVGFLINENILIWDKQRTTTPFKGLEYPSAYEPIIFGHKPPRARHLLLPNCSNIMRIPALHGSKKLHRFQKPAALVEHLIRNSSNIGDSILDTFCGSGVTLRVAKELNRNALGFEISKDNWARAQVVLEQGVAGALKTITGE